MKLPKDIEQLFAKLGPLTCRADLIGSPLALRANGKEITSSTRDEMLQKANAKEYVELDVDVLAFEQVAGVMNRNFVRFRDGAMMGLGRTGKDKPFLRDHEQGDVLARAGTILSSATEKRGEGDYAIRMTVRLTAPWAVDLALRGLLSSVSIGWNPTGPVECSVCKAAIFTKCWHCPGDRLSETTDDDGNPKKVRDRNGPITVEWVFTEAELVECSVVSVPAVPSAQIESIQAALAAHFPQLAIPADSEQPQKDEEMNLLKALAAILSLPTTAVEGDVIKAVEALKHDGDTAKAELAIATKELAISTKENEILSGEKKQSAEDKFIHGALSSGRITKGNEPEWRDLYKLSPDRAEKLMSGKPEGAATPVGLPRQSAVDVEPADAKPSTEEADVRAALTKSGADAGIALELAKKFGAKTPVKTIAKAIGLSKEA